MNGSEELQAYFGPGVERLGREAGLGAAEAGRVLREGLPLLLAAITEHARTPGGERQIAEAVHNLPRFASVEAALAEADGASTLHRAGQLLGPALLGPRAEAIAREVTGPSNPAGVQHLLQTALPVVLSFLGQRGLDVPGPTRIVVSVTPGIPPSVGEASGDLSSGTASGNSALGLSPQDLIEFLGAQLGGEAAARLGTLAGFGGSSAARAAQAALPVVLGAVARKGRNEAGAGVLLGRSGDFERLVGAGGGLDPHLLDDPTRVARTEGQGRSLLGTLFSNPAGVRTRLAAALGGSDESAGRLLALLAPLVLGLLVRWARAEGLDARRLGALLANLGPHLPGLLPAGLSGLTPLLNAEVREGPAPLPGPPPAPPRPARHRGVPGWLIPLLVLLLLGGLYLLRTGPAPNSALGAAGESITIGSPAPGATLPLADLTLRGTGRPGDTLSIEDGGLEIASTRVGADGTWRVTLSAPTLGEHAYAARGSSGATSGEVRVNVTAEDGPEPTDIPDDAPVAAEPTAPPSEAFAITEPAPGTRLSAGSFTLRGTGTPGESLQVLEDGTSLGNVTVGQDGAWSLDVPSPSPGAHTYAVYAGDATELGRVDVTVDGFEPLSATDTCDREYTLSLSTGQTVDQPFRFGGAGQGEGYRVTVRRDGRVVGTRDIPLDPTCGWSYQSRPGAGRVTYEVRPLEDSNAEPLSVVNVTVRP